MKYTIRDALADVLIREKPQTVTLQSDITEDMIAREMLQDNPNRVRSIGMNIICTHFRERDGTRHAVCPPGADTCYLHEDQENARAHPVSHLVKDAPGLLVMAGASIFFGPAAMKKVGRFLP